MNSRAVFFPLRDDNPTSRFAFVNWTLIGVCILAFLLELSNFDGVIQSFGFIPASWSILTVFTSMFLHAGLAHIAGNLWFLFIFGDNIEDAFGHIPYLGFYLAAGVVATFSHFVFNVGSSVPAVGASGAISGVLGAYLVLYPHASVYVSGGIGHTGKVNALVMLGLWFVFQFAQGVLGLFGAQSGVAFWAHIGGFVFGVIIGFIVKTKRAHSRA